MNKNALLSLFAILFLTLAVGTLAYMLLEGWDVLDSLYMSVIIITTIGFSEVHPLSEWGRIFTMGYSLVGFMLLAGVISLFSSSLVERLMLERKGGQRMLEKIKKLKGHILVCGSGKLGRHVIKKLLQQNATFVVLDHGEFMENLIQESQSPQSPLAKILYIEGDPTREEVLGKASLEKAFGIITCMPLDSENLFIGVTAKKIHPGIKWSTTILEETNASKFTTVGADDVIRGDFVIGNRLVNSMVNQNLFGFLEQTNPIDGSTGLIVGAVEVGASSPLRDKAIRDSAINPKLGLLVFAIRKNGNRDYQLNPQPDTLIQEKDVLISVGTPRQIESMEAFINPPKKGFWS